ncbi:MAG: sulfatase-like hydrolase/transferase, partial [Verrucomicrobia bacterium]|nr:sulfatase-like hydrolase/transferase [Verrucomicrobiota bacterium]
TLIIITADHGEELMERGHVGHCSCNLKGTLYDESIKVPLIMRYPRKLPQGKVIQRQISQIDIMPTVFDLLDLPKPSWMDGRSTLPLINGGAVEFREEVYAETTPAGWQALENDDREIWCVRTEEWKLILYTTADRHEKRWELFNLKSDPAEIKNIFDQRRDICDGLMPKLTAYLERAARAAPLPKC